jgi:hypothetical protein
MITKKDFINIADIIKNSRGDFNELVRLLIVYFKAVNPQFNEAKFIKACNQ